LTLHGHGLESKPEIVAVSKAELTGSEDIRGELEQSLGRQVLAISSVTGQGLAQLVGAVARELSATSARQPAEVKE
jgi:GTP-binding protein